jgi:hypothetical protein
MAISTSGGVTAVRRVALTSNVPPAYETTTTTSQRSIVIGISLTTQRPAPPGSRRARAQACRDALDLNPDSAAARWTLAKTQLGQGKASAALELLEPLVGESRWTPALGDHGQALGLCGRSEEARAVLVTLTSASAYVRPYDLALVRGSARTRRRPRSAREGIRRGRELAELPAAGSGVR